MDEELEAIQKIVIALDARPLEEQGRIMGYLFERFPITPLAPRQVLQPGDYYFVCGNGAIVFQRPIMGIKRREFGLDPKP